MLLSLGLEMLGVESFSTKWWMFCLIGVIILNRFLVRFLK